jgi:hypothetical protein
LFSDPACQHPAVVVFDGAPVPAFAELATADGCTSHHAVGAERSGPVYRRQPGGCQAIAVDPDAAVYDAAAPLGLVELERVVEQEPERRLQRILLAGEGLRLPDRRLHDTATREDCHAMLVDGVTRCMPEALALVDTFHASPICDLVVPVTQLPQPTCRRPQFARQLVEGSFGELRAIGDPVADILYVSLLGSSCSPYFPSPGTMVHSLGPPLEVTLFVGGLLFGER